MPSPYEEQEINDLHAFLREEAEVRKELEEEQDE